jgi:hypothetical protein
LRKFLPDRPSAQGTVSGPQDNTPRVAHGLIART